MNHCRCEELRAELKAIKGDREVWSATSLEQFNRIGTALYPIRKKRASGEPARDDATEIEQLAKQRARFRAVLEELRLAMRDGTTASAFAIIDRELAQGEK